MLSGEEKTKGMVKKWRNGMCTTAQVTFGRFWSLLGRKLVDGSFFFFVFLGKFLSSALDIIVDLFFAGDWLALKTFLEVAVLRLELAEQYVA